MERNNSQSTFSLVLNLALKTMQYVIVTIALVLVATIIIFPTVGENFYSSAGNKPLAYRFAVNATGKNASVERVRKTADRAIALMLDRSTPEKDMAEYVVGAEKYCLALLNKPDIANYFAEIDAENVASVKENRILHVRLCDSFDYYTSALYTARLKQNKTDFFVQGKFVAVADFVEYAENNVLSADECVYVVRQAAMYVDYCAKNGVSDILEKVGFTEFYINEMNKSASDVDCDRPELKKLFRISVYSGFYKAYKTAHPESDIGEIRNVEGFDSIDELCDYCTEKYCNNK